MTQNNIHERREYIAALIETHGPRLDYRVIAKEWESSPAAILNDIKVVIATKEGCTIYGLCEPDTGAIRYVGQTDGDPNYRFAQHFKTMNYGRDNNIEKVKWMKELLKRRKMPELVILEKCPKAMLNERERWWIKHLLSEGASLLNIRGNPDASRRNGQLGGRPRKDS